MAERPQKVIVNAATGETKYVDLTDEEITEREVRAAEAEAQRIADEEAQAAQEAAAASAREKLAALGLSEEEIAAITA